MNVILSTIFRDRLFPETSVRNIIFQLLQGLSYMHKLGKIRCLVENETVGKILFYSKDFSIVI